MSGFSVPAFNFIYQGLPAASGTLNVYQTGTTTPVIIYSDGALTTPLSNPLTLDGNGQAKFYVTGAVNLRLDAYTQSGTLIQSIDPVYPVGSGTIGTVIDQGTNLTLTAAYVGNNIIATAPITITLPLTTTLSNAFYIDFNAQSGAITFAPQSTDKINLGSSGASYIAAQGASGRLWTDAMGNWGTNFLYVVPKSFVTLKRQVFTSTGTYTPSAGMLYCDVEVWGAGGGGGGVGSVAVTAAAGGGAGGYSKKSFSAAAIGASQTVTIGAGGTAGAGTTSGTGGTGGGTAFGGLINATGGAGGGATTGSTIPNQGVGGSGSGGTVNNVGQTGGYPFFGGTILQACSGQGGNTSLGGCGPSVGGAQAAGNAATSNSGSGASGAVSNGVNSAGGVGGSGFCVVTEYCSQ